MNSIVKPVKAISFEEALRNLASRLTGTPAAELPRTQEALVQYMAEHIPSLDDMAEAVTQEAIARLSETIGANMAPTEPQDGTEDAGGASIPPAAETPQEAVQAVTEDTPKPTTTRKSKK